VHFWSSTELALTVVGVLCSDPNKYLGIYLKKKITKKKGNVEKSRNWEKKEEDNLVPRAFSSREKPWERG